MTRVPIEFRFTRFTEPLVRDARAMVQRHADRVRIVPLAAFATDTILTEAARRLESIPV
jgi:hypothetical protein